MLSSTQYHDRSGYLGNVSLSTRGVGLGLTVRPKLRSVLQLAMLGKFATVVGADRSRIRLFPNG